MITCDHMIGCLLQTVDVPCAVCTAYCILHTACCILHTAYCAVLAAFWNVLCLLHSVNLTLHEGLGAEKYCAVSVRTTNADSQSRASTQQHLLRYAA